MIILSRAHFIFCFILSFEIAPMPASCSRNPMTPCKAMDYLIHLGKAGFVIKHTWVHTRITCGTEKLDKITFNNVLLPSDA